MERTGLVIALLVLTYLQARLWILPGNQREVDAAEHALQVLQQENQRLAERNAEEEAWVRLLENDPHSIELLAREQMDLVREGETLYLTPR